MWSGSAKANGREPKSCLGRVFNFKLGYSIMYAIAQHIQERPSLELKTRPQQIFGYLPLAFVLPSWVILTNLSLHEYWPHQSSYFAW
jgi:hypothetical protein